MRLGLVVFFLFSSYCFGQNEKTYKVRTIAFYNVENLFDTENDTLVFDDQRTSKGRYRWTKKRYQKKINDISRVISQIGYGLTGSSPDIVGLCEVENKKVIEDLINDENLLDKDYGIIHFDSPDERGIDVALLYKKEVFLPTSFKSQRVLLFDTEGKRDYTRDQLVVGGLLDKEQFYFIVNHWPSRSGGEARSKPNRIKAAQRNKRTIDSIQKLNNSAKIISMGDFNDDPVDDSFKKVLKSIGKLKKLDSTSLFNPMERLFKKGAGSLAYRDKWNLFDQFVLTPNLISKNRQNHSFWKAGIFNPSYLENSQGKYKGYPFRTYVGTTYQGGYADHFPIYLYLVKEVQSSSNSLKKGRF